MRSSFCSPSPSPLPRRRLRPTTPRSTASCARTSRTGSSTTTRSLGPSAFGAYLERLAAASLDGLRRRSGSPSGSTSTTPGRSSRSTRHGERDSIRNINRDPGPAPAQGTLVGEDGPRGRARPLPRRRRARDRPRRSSTSRASTSPWCAPRLGCPPLRSEAYTGARLEEQLDDQARAFLLRSPARNRVDAARRTVWVSPILVWYRSDFGGTTRPSAASSPATGRRGRERALLLSGRFRLRETDYDWRLNRVGAKRRQDGR